MSDNKVKKISVYNDFSPNAFGRYITDGPNSGERFREEYLLPFWDYKCIEVDFSGFESSPGSSFLSSSFLELITRCNKTYQEVKDKIVILPSDSVYPYAVESLLERAK